MRKLLAITIDGFRGCGHGAGCVDVRGGRVMEVPSETEFYQDVVDLGTGEWSRFARQPGVRRWVWWATGGVLVLFIWRWAMRGR